MKIKNIFIIICITLSTVNAQGLSRSLRAVADARGAQADSVRNVWVFFNTQNNIDEQVREIEKIGAAHRQTIGRLNAASFSARISTLNTIAALPYVDAVTPVARFIRDVEPVNNELNRRADLGRVSAIDRGYLWHNEMVGIPLAHAYLKAKGFGAPGSGVLMAFLDAGFIKEHAAFARMRDSSQLVAAYDFVDNHDSPFDPSPTIETSLRPGYRHGAQVLAIAAAYMPQSYIGAAYGASFALARTEDVEVEMRIEEDNWAAAMYWALDTLGAHIISSSLGYRDYDDPDESWPYWALDGKTTVISRAAADAVSRGAIVVNSIGNEGRQAATRTLTAPADADGVIAVGAVNANRVLADFSSTGPTADGRMKPDVVAPGSNIPLILPYPVSANGIGSGNGTSFAAPIVSSIMALILQAHPNISSDSAMARLYNSCTFANEQTALDNRHGRGIPNALRALMNDNEIFMRVTDRNGLPLAGAKIFANGDVYEVTEQGYVVIDASRNNNMPADYQVFFRGDAVGSFIVNALPYVGEASIDVDRGTNELTARPQVVIRRGNVLGRYVFSGLDFDVPAVVSVHTLNGRTVWRENLVIARDGTAEFTWNRRTGRRVASGAYVMTVKHGYNLVSTRVRILE